MNELRTLLKLMRGGNNKDFELASSLLDTIVENKMASDLELTAFHSLHHYTADWFGPKFNVWFYNKYYDLRNSHYYDQEIERLKLEMSGSK